jgi:dolichyl-phosphate beta-glucosyltransferase
MMLRCSIVIPAYNEEKLISITLNSLAKYILKNKLTCEIIVADDGSSDQTVPLVKDFISQQKGRVPIRLLENSSNHGKGYVLRQGMLSAAGEVAIFMDADLPFELDIINGILSRVGSECQVAIGSRVMPGSTLVDVPFIRFIAGQVFSWFVQLLAFKGIRDTQCGVKGFRLDVAKRIFPLSRINDFGLDVELLFLAKKFGYSICPLPVRMTGFRGDSRVRLFDDSLKMFWELVQIRWNDLTGRYSVPGD